MMGCRWRVRRASIPPKLIADEMLVGTAQWRSMRERFRLFWNPTAAEEVAGQVRRYRAANLRLAWGQIKDDKLGRQLRGFPAYNGIVCLADLAPRDQLMCCPESMRSVADDPLEKNTAWSPSDTSRLARVLVQSPANKPDDRVSEGHVADYALTPLSRICLAWETVK